MKTTLPILLLSTIGLLVAACGGDEGPSTPDAAAQKGKLRVEYYEISKK